VDCVCSDRETAKDGGRSTRLSASISFPIRLLDRTHMSSRNCSCSWRRSTVATGSCPISKMATTVSIRSTGITKIRPSPASESVSSKRVSPYVGLRSPRPLTTTCSSRCLQRIRFREFPEPVVCSQQHIIFKFVPTGVQMAPALAPMCITKSEISPSRDQQSSGRDTSKSIHARKLSFADAAAHVVRNSCEGNQRRCPQQGQGASPGGRDGSNRTSLPQIGH